MWSLLLQLVNLLQTCEAMGVVHADLKPQFIYLKNNKEIALSFFGNAKLGTGRSLDKEGVAYLSPKLLKARNEHSSTSKSSKDDIYALGITLGGLVLNGQPVS